jgi:hypothetical protein
MASSAVEGMSDELVRFSKADCIAGQRVEAAESIWRKKEEEGNRGRRRSGDLSSSRSSPSAVHRHAGAMIHCEAEVRLIAQGGQRKSVKRRRRLFSAFPGFRLCSTISSHLTLCATTSTAELTAKAFIDNLTNE